MRTKFSPDVNLSASDWLGIGGDVLRRPPIGSSLRWALSPKVKQCWKMMELVLGRSKHNLTTNEDVDDDEEEEEDLMSSFLGYVEMCERVGGQCSLPLTMYLSHSLTLALSDRDILHAQPVPAILILKLGLMNFVQQTSEYASLCADYWGPH